MNKVQLSGKIKTSPVSDDVNGKAKASCILEYLPYDNAQYPQTVKLEGWREASELVMQRYQGEEVNVNGRLNITAKKKDSGEWINYISVVVESFPGTNDVKYADPREKYQQPTQGQRLR